MTFDTCIVTIQGRFVNVNGVPSSTHLTYEKFWKRYLAVYKQVVIVGRLFDNSYCDASTLKPVEGPGVTFYPLPAYTGAKELLSQYSKISNLLKNLYSRDAVYILRVPCIVSILLSKILIKKKHPFAVEVVGDPYDSFAPQAIRTPLRPLIRLWATHMMRHICRKASASSYVTKNSLQNSYPCKPGCFTTYYSSIDLPDYAFLDKPKFYDKKGKVLISIGTMSQLYKGHKTLIDAFLLCIKNGLDLRLIIVGDGKYKPFFLEHIIKHNLSDRIHLTGLLPSGKPIYDMLDTADLFVLPSYQEGLPRVMLEAMARGMPCIGSNVGGIPELLPKQYMVSPGNCESLAQKIIDIVNDPGRMSEMSKHNLSQVQEYRRHVLTNRRNLFYTYLKEHTTISIR
ncbi:MAG: glycosyltransferase family 4 protein [Bacteroidota bacterium]